LPYSPLLSWIIPLAGSFLMPILAKLNRSIRDWTPFLLVAVSSIFTFSMFPDVYNGYSSDTTVWWIPYFNLTAGVLVDSLSVFMASLVSFIGALILLYSIGYMAEEEGLTRYYFFMLLFIGAMIGLVMADNFFQLYIFWEIVGLCSYALIGFWYKKPEAVKAGMKAFIVTRVGDLCLLIGILILYFNSGSFNFLALKNQLTTGLLDVSLVTNVALLLFGGAIGKSAQVPLFVWLPDAMEGPTTVSALIHAATMVKAGVYLMARTTTIFSFSTSYMPSMALVGAVTAFMAATMALATFDIKRVLAYSTISQLGYMFIALGVGSSKGWLASQFHLMSHAFFKALLFLCAGAVIHTLGTRDMRKMGGLRKHMPITFATFIVGALSLSAIPPFNGFWSKDMVLESAYMQGGYFGYLIFFIGVVTAALTFAYTIRMIAFVFLGEESEFIKNMDAKPREAPKIMITPLLILAFACLTSGFLQSPFASTFSQIITVGNVAAFTKIEVEPLIYSLLSLLIGGLPAYLVYMKRIVPPQKITEKRFMSLVYKVLANGYYFDSFYNLVFVKGTALVSSKVRKLQTGILNFNMLALLMSILCFIILVFQGGIM
ncbi:NADH-quinone oxidoreductase subunit L, partial [Candidatus Bathyarchaeota archaeon]